jgi:hypothetical protein
MLLTDVDEEQHGQHDGVRREGKLVRERAGEVFPRERVQAEHAAAEGPVGEIVCEAVEDELLEDSSIGQHPDGAAAEHVERAVGVGYDGVATDVVKGSASTPSTSAWRCTDWVVYAAGLRQHRAGSKSRTATGNQESWRPSSSTRASTTTPNGRGEGGPDDVLLDLHEEDWICLDLHLLALDGGIPLLGREAEVLARSGVLANTVDVDLALEEHGESHREDGVGAD